LQAAWSRTAPATVRHVPGAFSGLNACGPVDPSKGKSCESVTSPPPSARPPHEKSSTWFPAARRGSKLKQAWVCSCQYVHHTMPGFSHLHTDDEHAPSLIVVLSFSDHIPCLVIASITLSDLDWGEVGTEVARKLVNEQTLAIRSLRCKPKWSGESERHTLIGTEEKARVAVSSRC
jgi:hypothetical protein